MPIPAKYEFCTFLCEATSPGRCQEILSKFAREICPNFDVTRLDYDVYREEMKTGGGAAAVAEAAVDITAAGADSDKPQNKGKGGNVQKAGGGGKGGRGGGKGVEAGGGNAFDERKFQDAKELAALMTSMKAALRGLIPQFFAVVPTEEPKKKK